MQGDSATIASYSTRITRIWAPVEAILVPLSGPLLGGNFISQRNRLLARASYILCPLLNGRREAREVILREK